MARSVATRSEDRKPRPIKAREAVSSPDAGRDEPEGSPADEKCRLADRCRRLVELSRSVIALTEPTDAAARLLEVLNASLGSDAAALFRFDPDAGRLLPLSVLEGEPGLAGLASYGGNGAIGRAFKSGRIEQALRSRDSASLPTTPERLLAVPVVSGGEVLGVLAAARSSEAPYSGSDLELAELLAGYASLSLEKLAVESREREIAERIRRLSPFSRRLKRHMTLPELAQAVGEGALALSGADRVAVYSDGDRQGCHLWSRGVSPAYAGALLGHLHSLIHEDLGGSARPHFTGDVERLPRGSLRRRLAEVEGHQALAVFPLVYAGQTLAGVDCYYDHPHGWNSFERELLEVFSHQAALAFENVRLQADLEQTYLETVLTLARAVDARDAYTATHSLKLADWAAATAQQLGLPGEEVQTIRWAALLHDIGKIGVPDAILRKPGPLTEEEWAVMKRHPIIGAEIVAPVKRLQPVTPLILYHQEKYDGSGYPDGLKGEQIPLGARILTVVDAFGAMTDDRVYRRARSREEAAAELQRCAGKHFDRRVVDVFSRVVLPPG